MLVLWGTLWSLLAMRSKYKCGLSERERWGLVLFVGVGQRLEGGCVVDGEKMERGA